MEIFDTLSLTNIEYPPPELELLVVDSETLGETNTEYPHTQTIPLDLCVETEGYHLVQWGKEAG